MVTGVPVLPQQNAKLRSSNGQHGTLLGPPVVPFYPFFGEGSPTTIVYRKNGYPYSNLSTGGPSCFSFRISVNRRNQSKQMGATQRGGVGAEGLALRRAAERGLGGGDTGVWVQVPMDGGVLVTVLDPWNTAGWL